MDLSWSCQCPSRCLDAVDWRRYSLWVRAQRNPIVNAAAKKRTGLRLTHSRQLARLSIACLSASTERDSCSRVCSTSARACKTSGSVENPQLSSSLRSDNGRLPFCFCHDRRCARWRVAGRRNSRFRSTGDSRSQRRHTFTCLADGFAHWVHVLKPARGNKRGGNGANQVHATHQE